MSNIVKITGERIRARRLELGYSQETTAEKADLHPTYIGQLERGEKNATLESIEKVCNALDYPMEQLFKNIAVGGYNENVADKCYSLILKQPVKEQEYILKLLNIITEHNRNM